MCCHRSRIFPSAKLHFIIITQGILDIRIQSASDEILLHQSGDDLAALAAAEHSDHVFRILGVALGGSLDVLQGEKQETKPASILQALFIVIIIIIIIIIVITIVCASFVDQNVADEPSFGGH